MLFVEVHMVYYQFVTCLSLCHRLCGHKGVSHCTIEPLSNPENSAIRKHSFACKTNINFND